MLFLPARIKTMPQAPGGFAQTYGVELLCETPPALSLNELLRAIRRHRPAAEPLDKSGGGERPGVCSPRPPRPAQGRDGSRPDLHLPDGPAVHTHRRPGTRPPAVVEL